VLDAACCYRCSAVSLLGTSASLAEMAEPFEMPFEMWTCVGPKNHVLDRVHIGATWRVRFNDSCSAAMRPYVKLL